MNPLHACLHSIEIGAPLTAGPLTLFPLLRTAAPPAAYALLDDALQAGLAEVTEVSEDGSVPELRFRNLGDRDVLLVDGEELVGARQNRVLNLTVLVGARQQVTIPVSCVEAGRWAWRTRQFAAGGRKLNASARREKMRGVSDALRDSGARACPAVQREVWHSIEVSLSRAACTSETGALHDAYAALDSRLEPLRAAVKALPGQVGAVFAHGGAIAGVELFDAPDTLARLLPKLVDSYLLDAMDLEPDAAPNGGAAAAPTLAEVRALLERIAAAEPEAYPAIARGVDLRVQTPGLHAAALADGDRVVHLSAFEGGAGPRAGAR